MKLCHLKTRGMVIALASLITSAAYGYCKYRYLNYDFGLTNEGRAEQVDRITRGKAPFSPQLADYAFVDKEGVFHSCVLLNSSDRRRLRNQLSEYDKNAVITEEMVQAFLSGGRRKRSVGWVLRDFKTANERATIADVLNVLHLQVAKPAQTKQATVLAPQKSSKA